MTRTPRPLVLAAAVEIISRLPPALAARCASRFSSATRRCDSRSTFKRFRAILDGGDKFA